MESLILFLLVSLPCCLSTDLDREWWKRAEIYDIPVWLFKDSDGDAIGDINGIRSKLDHFEDLGISTIKLSPIFSSVYNINPTYAIDNFQKIHVSVGEMEDFDNLMTAARNKGIKVILDFVINHCSTYHEWFEKSRRRIDPFTDYFIWNDEEPRYRDYEYWSYETIRKQWYYHHFENSVDLNLRNKAVKDEVKKLIKFWFDKGVSGLNLLSVDAYMEDFANKVDRYSYDTYINHPDSWEFVHELREYVDSYNEANGGHERILMVDETPIEEYPDLHGNGTFPIAHVVSKKIFQNFGTYLNYFEAPFFDSLVTQMIDGNENGPRLIISENDDEGSVRLPNRFNNKALIDVWLTSIFMLPVAVHIHYGQEVSLADFWINNYHLGQIRPLSSAMHWDNSLLAGFTSSEFSLILPNTDCWKNNVEGMKNTSYSRYNMMRKLLKLRKSEVVKNGDVKTHIISNWIYAFTRSYKGEETYITILNLENKSNIITLQNTFENLPQKVQVLVSSPNAIHLEGTTLITSSPIILRPTSSIVVVAK